MRRVHRAHRLLERLRVQAVVQLRHRRWVGCLHAVLRPRPARVPRDAGVCSLVCGPAAGARARRHLRV